MSVVLAFGSFNLIHVGHLRALQEATESADQLAIAVASDELVTERTGEVPTVSAAERMELVAAFFPDARVEVVDDDRASALVGRFDPTALVVPDVVDGVSSAHLEPLDVRVVDSDASIAAAVLRNSDAEVLWLPRRG